jgi:hypothetical protein
MKRYLSAAVVLIVGSILLLFGWVVVIAPGGNAWQPLGGLVVGTIGIAVWKCCDLAFLLGKAGEYARHFMQLALLFCPLMALGGGHSGGGGVNKAWSAITFGSILGMESVAVLIRLTLPHSSKATSSQSE